MNTKAILAFIYNHKDLLIMVLCACLLAIPPAVATYRYTKNQYEAVISKMEEEKAKLAAANAQLEANANKVTIQVVTEYVDRVNVVKEKGDTIVKEVPVYITQTAEEQCKLTEGFAAIHDAAVLNEEPNMPEDVDAPLDVSLADVTKTVVGNYNTCNQTKEQLLALQEWVRKQRANAESMNK
jgi:hypothetical protein